MVAVGDNKGCVDNGHSLHGRYRLTIPYSVQNWQVIHELIIISTMRKATFATR